MQKFKSVMLAMAVGIIVGGAVTDLVGPAFLTWYNIPGGGQALCNCADIVGATAQNIIKAHWIGGFLGGVLFAIGALSLGGGGKDGKTASRGPTPPV